MKILLVSVLHCVGGVYSYLCVGGILYWSMGIKLPYLWPGLGQNSFTPTVFIIFPVVGLVLLKVSGNHGINRLLGLIYLFLFLVVFVWNIYFILTK